AREFGDDGVELGCAPVGADDLSGFRQLSALEHRGFEAGQPLTGVSLSRQLEGEHVEDRAHLVEVGDVAGGEHPDRRPRVRPVRDQSFGSELLQRLPDGHAGDTELGREIALDELLSRLPVAVDDLVAQDLGDPYGLRTWSLICHRGHLASLRSPHRGTERIEPDPPEIQGPGVAGLEVEVGPGGGLRLVAELLPQTLTDLVARSLACTPEVAVEFEG